MTGFDRTADRRKGGDPSESIGSGHRRRRTVRVVEGQSQESRARLLAGLIVAIAVVVDLQLARPFGSAGLAFDTQVSALSFDRILSGHRLEQFISTTPKPLLTVVDGLLRAITGDWRPVEWATIAAAAVAAGMFALLAARIAGLAAGAFVGIGLTGLQAVVFDVGVGLATPWAMLGWAAAGLAVARDRPRYGWAAIGLAIGTLARLETIMLVLVIGFALVAGQLAGRRPPARAWLIPIGEAGAVAVMSIHDWLLTGNPLYWSTVSAIYSARTQLDVLGAGDVVALILGRVAENPGLGLLAALGVVALLARRQTQIVVGVLGLAGGVAGLALVLATRGIFVSERYLAGFDVAVVFLAGIGLSDLTSRSAGPWLSDRLSRFRARIRDPRASWFAPIVGAGAVAALLIWPTGVLDRSTRETVRLTADAAIAADHALPVLRSAIRDVPAPTVYVPTIVRPRLSLDLARPLTDLRGTNDSALVIDARSPPPGSIIFHVPSIERDSKGLTAVEVDQPVSVNGRRIVPLWTESTVAAWVCRVE